jgi:A/G-specific adenine glycosylase
MVFYFKGAIGIRQRQQKDIWQGLHEFYAIESAAAIHWDEAMIHQWLKEQFGLKNAEVKQISPTTSQQLTHQQITGQFIHIQLKQLPTPLKGLIWVNEADIREFAFPRIITAYMESFPNNKTMMVDN